MVGLNSNLKFEIWLYVYIIESCNWKILNTNQVKEKVHGKTLQVLSGDVYHFRKQKTRKKSWTNGFRCI